MNVVGKKLHVTLFCANVENQVLLLNLIKNIPTE